MAYSVIFVLLLFNLSFCLGGYKTVYLEDDCRNGISSVTYNLGSIGYNSTMILRPTRYNTYAPSKYCVINIVAPSGSQVVAAVRKIDFASIGCTDSLLIYSNDGQKTLCYPASYDKESNSFYSSGSSLRMDYRTGSYIPNLNHMGFQLTLSALSNYHCYDSNKFRCKNDKCIASVLRCDGHNNCGDVSDEDYGTNGGCGKNLIGVIASVVTAGCIIIIIISLAIICCRRRRRRHREIIIKSTTLIAPADYGAVSNPPYAPNPYHNTAGGIENPLYATSAPPPPPYAP